jgi:predicted nucleic acid-binding Zn ribbon protein
MAGKKDNQGAIHVGDAIKQLLKQYHIDTKFDEANVVGSWERLVGKPIARSTKKVFLRNHVLFVELTSPSLKHDLSYSKSHILELFQKEFGKDIVKEIVLM